MRTGSKRADYASGAKKRYGAIAALRYEAGADLYAKRKGVFVLEGRNGFFSITNEDNFRPKPY